MARYRSFSFSKKIKKSNWKDEAGPMVPYQHARAYRLELRSLNTDPAGKKHSPSDERKEFQDRWQTDNIQQGDS